MQKCTYMPDLSFVGSQPYFVHQYRDFGPYHGSQNCFVILFFRCDGSEKDLCVYHGARTGEPVGFSRRSNAERLCSALNSAGVYAV